jgi:hypothetical protein
MPDDLPEQLEKAYAEMIEAFAAVQPLLVARLRRAWTQQELESYLAASSRLEQKRGRWADLRAEVVTF